MMQSHTSATRQELLKLKDKLKSASRGYKLLKDKRDSLIQIFILSYREASELRKKIDNLYIQARSRYALATSDISPSYIEALAQTSQMSIEINMKVKNIMGVKVQEFETQTQGTVLTYSRLQTNYHLDHALLTMKQILPDLMLLIEKEYKVRKLAEEIEKTRKRVNALEYVILPDLKSQIKYIRTKLDEMALQNTVRLMKIKQQIMSG